VTLNEIITKIKRYYPKAETWLDAEIVSILNDEQREIFRELQLTDIYEFETVQGQMTYSLPSNCEIEFISYVGLTKDNPITDKSRFQKYTPAETNEQLIGYRYFDAFNGLIGLYPVPDATGYNVRLIYEKRPALLDVNNLTAIPELREDWHRILVYAAIAEIAGAGSNPDITIVNNYTQKYNKLMEEIVLAKYRNRPFPKTKDWRR
jgi:hypothetical protein